MTAWTNRSQSNYTQTSISPLMRKIWSWLLPWILQNLIKKKKPFGKENVCAVRFLTVLWLIWLSGLFRLSLGAKQFPAVWKRKPLAGHWQEIWADCAATPATRSSAVPAHANLSKCTRAHGVQLSLLSCFLRLEQLWLCHTKKHTKQAKAHTNEPIWSQCCGCGEAASN